LIYLGTGILRYGLVLLLIAIGSTKFFAFEARAIQPLVAHSPFASWLYPALGSVAAVLTFLTTLSFLFTTPGALMPGSDAGAFLVKDIVLLGAAVYTAGEALRAVAGPSRS
jgi:reactive chlorine resistance protein C